MALRVGFLGAGLIATYHSKSLRRSGADAKWAGVYDIDRDRAEQFARPTGATLCQSEEEVLDTCDAVYICTWTAEHPRLVAAAAQRGLAVFCEKPLGVNLAAATEVAATVQAAGVANQVGLVLRRSPAFALLRSMVRAQESGRVMSVVFRDDQYLPVQGTYASSWRADARLAGAGTLLEHSIHDIDLLEWLVGPVAAVSGQTRSFHGLPGIEDLAVVSLSFADDGGAAVGTLTSAWHDVLARPSLRRVEVLCERAWFALEGDWWGPLTWTRADGSQSTIEGAALEEAATAACGAAELGNPDGAFVDAVLSGRPATPSVNDALRAHVVADAIYRSAGAGGATTPVPPPA